MKNQVYLKNVVTLRLDENKCTGCGMCLDVCPHEVFKMNGKHVMIRDRDACMECGACAQNCPANAVSVESGVGCAAAGLPVLAVVRALVGRAASAPLFSVVAGAMLPEAWDMMSLILFRVSPRLVLVPPAGATCCCGPRWPHLDNT